MKNLLAQNFFGKITPPEVFSPEKYGDFSTPGKGIVFFANNILKLLIVGAGIYAFLNIIIAGYEFLGAGGDVKKVEAAWKRIWQSLLGLAFVAGSFVLAAIFGWLIFKDPTAILSPKIYGPQ